MKHGKSFPDKQEEILHSPVSRVGEEVFFIASGQIDGMARNLLGAPRQDEIQKFRMKFEIYENW